MTEYMRLMKKAKTGPSYLSEILEKYSDRAGVIIYVGLYEGSIMIDVTVPKAKGRRGRISSVLIESVRYHNAIPRIEDYYECREALIGYKIARRWFMKRARKLRYGDYLLEDFLIDNYNSLDHAKIEKLLSLL